MQLWIYLGALFVTLFMILNWNKLSASNMASGRSHALAYYFGYLIVVPALVLISFGAAVVGYEPSILDNPEELLEYGKLLYGVVGVPLMGYYILVAKGCWNAAKNRRNVFVKIWLFINAGQAAMAVPLLLMTALSIGAFFNLGLMLAAILFVTKRKKRRQQRAGNAQDKTRMPVKG